MYLFLILHFITVCFPFGDASVILYYSLNIKKDKIFISTCIIKQKALEHNILRYTNVGWKIHL